MSPPDQIRPGEVEILIAEDSPTQAEQLKQLLAGHGFGVVAAGNGREALAAALARPPTLVITDIVMPEMDGYELCAALKADAQLKDIPVVMVTSLAGIQDIAKSLECGADNFIRKPYEPKALLARIEYILLNLELRKTSRVRMGMEIYMGGKKHFIASGREQIVDLLISTYEEAVRMNEELQQQQQEIALSNRTLRVLYRIAADLNRVSTEVEVCEQALQGILDLSGFRAGWVFLDEGAGGLRLAAASKLPGVLLAPGVMEGDCRCRRMLQAGELRRGAALVECERLQKHGGEAVKMHSHVSTPLSVGHQILGIMNVVGGENGAVGADDLRLLEAVGSQVAVAIQRAQLYQHLEALVGQRTAALQAEIVERTRAQAKVASLNRIYAVLSGINTTIVRVHDRLELFQETCRIAVEMGKFSLAWIGEVTPDRLQVKPVAWRGEAGELVPPETIAAAGGVFGRVLRECGTVSCNDLETCAESLCPTDALAAGCRSMAVFPLLVGGRVEGVVALYAAERDVFDAVELELLKELAGDISFALEYIRKSEQLDYQVYYDVLTGLPNRGLIHDRLSQLLQTVRHDPGPSGLVAVVLINIERFKNINDSFGRRRGDALLKAVAGRLGAALGATDHLSRIGSDHFAAILSGLDEAADVARFLDDAILPCFERNFDIDAKEFHVAVKVGVALFPADGNDAETLFANAETALRKVATAGERYLFYAPQMNARVAEQLTLENKLHRALEREEFVLHYQPKVDLRNGDVVGVEALIRWRDPAGGLVSPVEFIPILEETGMIVEVGRWALRQAIADYWRWHADGLQPPRVAVNVSAVQLRRKDFLETLAAAMERHAGEHNYLDLELTEAMLIADIEANVLCLGAVCKMGVKIAVDDFGTGYSSLSYLKRFPIDYLKIDQSFVRDITTTPDAAAICIAIISLAHSLRLKVIAEGVETEGQMNYLRRHGCDEIQGFLFSQPLPAEACAQLLRERRTLALPAAVGERKTLLIVDDEPGILSSLKRVLRRDGYEILAVGSAREGFDVLASHEVQVILSDQRMPEMNGTEFLSRVRELYPDTIRIVLSGYTDLDTIIGAINRGAIYRFLTKPWDDDLLREHIREAFRHQEARGARREAADER